MHMTLCIPDEEELLKPYGKMNDAKVTSLCTIDKPVAFIHFVAFDALLAGRLVPSE